MSFVEKYLNIRRVGACVVLVFVGLMFAGFGIWGILSPNENYQSVNGTISEIDEYYDMLENNLEGETKHKVYVDFIADGKKYTEVEYPAYSSSMKEGGTVTILYDPENPTEIQSPGGEKIPYIFAAVGTLMVAAGVFVVVMHTKRTKG